MSATSRPKFDREGADWLKLPAAAQTVFWCAGLDALDVLIAKGLLQRGTYECPACEGTKLDRHRTIILDIAPEPADCETCNGFGRVFLPRGRSRLTEL